MFVICKTIIKFTRWNLLMDITDFEGINRQPYICIQKGQAIEANKEFLILTGYGREELIGKDILYILNKLMLLNKKVGSIDKISAADTCFFFNKLLDFKEISIQVLKSIDTDLIYLIFKQHSLINLDNLLSYTHQLISDNLIGIAIYSADDFTLLKASKEYEKIIYNRYKQTDIVGKKAHEFLYGWQESPAKEVWEKVIQTGKTVYNLDHENINPTTGVTEYYDSSVSPILNNNKVKFLVAHLNDITDKTNYKKEIEKKALMIEKQKVLLETVIEKQKDSVFIIDKNGDIILNNKADNERYVKGLTNIRELHQAAEYFDEAGNKLSFEQMPIHRLMAGDRLDNFKMRLKMGEYTKYINLNGTAIFDEEGSFTYAFLFGTDVTEIVESRQQLVDQKEQLEAIMNNMADAIFLVDKDGKFISKNNAAINFYEEEPIVLSDVLTEVKYFEMDGRAILLQELPVYRMMQGENVSDRVMVMRTSNREVYVSVNANPILDADGKFIMGVLAFRDITEYMQHEETIKAQQQALLIAEKKEKENLENVIAMKDDFLSLISHEFKTPLTVINSALQAMDFLYKDQLSGKIKNYFDMIKQNTNRQVRLVNNLLDITGANAGHIKLNMKNRDIVLITRVIVESVSLYANQKGVNISFESCYEEKSIAVDEEKYERILLNLLSNAIKFTPKGKNIKVVITNESDKVRIMVMDEGIGIPIEKHGVIFERFGQVDSSYTRQAEGSGIGLTLVKLMVNAMGGHIYVESQAGVGSSFFVELPDVTGNDEAGDGSLKQIVDSRLIQAIAIEFSDIYL
jgi:PAS domain S-box-containing protein